MSIEPCLAKLAVQQEQYGFPFDVFCKKMKGHEGSCVAVATIDGVEITVDFEIEKKI